ncbi:peptidoglycan-associated lipoprotein Pal [Corallincola spongiicola]|uniref:Peptidoglycan-associated lipoprotein n=1 Tax=Corallincola spongiicola TaxID=2520508 RepID=A0ABY1WSL9_9GAMM|nr:peptidoglycan-associated lipoprotein Pal [Corallincola spongiicola]TAA47740.1 peptidoglycan-associated lipoprotein Pal [Corallincola spongiicola]
MRLKDLLKGVVVALPLFALMACSSTSDEVDTTSETATTEQTTPVVEDTTTETNVVEPVLTPEQEREMQQAELRKQHIIYFEFDQATVQNRFAQILDAHAAYLRANTQVKVLIEGHADERGTPEYNIALGERRAKAVAMYLQGLGVLDSQISIVSYGEEKPVDTSRTEAAFDKNRRAVLVY